MTTMEISVVHRLKFVLKDRGNERPTRVTTRLLGCDAKQRWNCLLYYR